MKITKSQLKQIILEETSCVLSEQEYHQNIENLLSQHYVLKIRLFF